MAEEESDAGANVIFSEYMNLLNAEQVAIFNKIREHIDSREGRIFFLDAPGGIGKTFLNKILAYVRMQNRIAVATVSSGLASSLLRLSRTAHSHFKLPISPEHTSTCNFTPQDKR